MASSKRRCCDQWIARTIHIFLTSMVLCIFFLKDTVVRQLILLPCGNGSNGSPQGQTVCVKDSKLKKGLQILCKSFEDKDPLSLQITNLAEEADDTTEMSKMILPEGKALRLRICGYCEIKQPLRSKHCEDCGRCVRRYDHHCPWLGNCVGERNHRFFLIFLLLESCVIGWAIDITWMAMKTKPKASIWFKANWVFLGLMIFLIISLLVVGLLFLCHSYMMLTAQTTWEFMSRPRISYLKHFPEDENPFDLGYIKNMYGFLCYCKPRTWEKILKEKAGWA